MGTFDFDLVVVGGGVSGLGVALRASKRGLKTLILEREQCCGATSNNSLRIIHGGFRYLQTLNIPRVLESIRAQSELIKIFPDLIVPIPCVLPLARRGFKSKWPVTIALKLFESLGSFSQRGVHLGKVLLREEIVRDLPVISSIAPEGVLLWWDALIKDPSALAGRLKDWIVSAGGRIDEGAEVTSVARVSGGFLVKVRTQEMTCRNVVDARGPWIGEPLEESLRNTFEGSWCIGFNVILKKQVNEKYAIAVPSKQGRLFFVTPREGVSVLGTDYLPLTGFSEKPSVPEKTVVHFVREFIEAFPASEVSIDDIEGIEWGILPTANPGSIIPCGKAQIADRNGYLTVLSTKYTTFLTQADKVVSRLR